MCAVLSTIKFIEEEHGWFYIGCSKCARKVVHKSETTEFEDIVVSDETDDDPLVCRKCKIIRPSLLPR